MASQDGVDAVNRALSILKAFDDNFMEMKLSTLAERTGLHKSTILRMVVSLEACGFLWRDDGGYYHLGSEVWRLGSLYRRSFDLGQFIRPTLKRLVGATLESASFYIREGDHRLCLYRENSPRAARHHIEEGVRLSLERGASGRILVAFGFPDDPQGAAIRRRGYYISLGERDPEVGAVAVPVIDAAGHLRGALSISGLLSRFDEEAQRNSIELLRKMSAELTAVLPVLD